MAIALLSVFVKHERRVRLVFSASLGAAAFTSVSYYSVVSQDSLGASPSVVAAIIVASSPNVVELQMSVDLVQGGTYAFFAEGVPAVDASTTPIGSNVVSKLGVDTVVPDGRAGTTQLYAVLYGRDIRFLDDFLEDHNNDLAMIAGLPNVREALIRRTKSDGLSWDQSFGLKAREFVDGTPTATYPLQGKAKQQMLADDRVKAATTTLEFDIDGVPSRCALSILVDLVGARAAGGDVLEVTVPL